MCPRRRFNLDPFGRFSDSALWGALEDVRLRSVVYSLDMPVAEGGANLSVGQRQLLSLARAVLLNRQVLLMDEATGTIFEQTNAVWASEAVDIWMWSLSRVSLW